MLTQIYSVTQPPIETLLSWVKNDEIAIPEIQRPFVWEAKKVRDLLDSLYRGYPIGYLIAWQNPNVRLKNGTHSSGKKIIIDGQQRIIALLASLLGREVINKDYQRVRIRIAFNPIEEKFEVWNTAIEKDPSWIPDISKVLNPHVSLLGLIKSYCQTNPQVSEDKVSLTLERLKGITANQIGLIELASDLDIETVTEIFIRVNSTGVPLSQADFAMSKIAVNEAYEGNILRKAIDYFCHLAVKPEAFALIENDKDFAQTDFFQKMAWLRHDKEDIYDPSYTDMLRVAFTCKFQRGPLEDGSLTFRKEFRNQAI